MKKSVVLKTIMWSLVVIILAVILIILLMAGLSKNKVYESYTPNYQPTGEIMPKCQQYNIQVEDVQMLELDKSLALGECSNVAGVGAKYGLFKSKWKFGNPNNIPLNIPCNLIVREYSQTGELIDEKIVESFVVNVPANWSSVVEKTFDMPKCYTWHGLDCKDAKDLAECS